MANGTLYYGSISLSKILKEAQNAHSAFYTGNDGKKYIKIKIWVNDEKDQFGNQCSILLAPKKDAETDKVYLGNLKFSEAKEQNFTKKDMQDIPNDDDLPF